MKLEDIFTFENLYSAHKECRKSKQHKGEVIRFEANLSANIVNMMNEIVTKKYELGGYRKFIVYEPKERLIEAPPYKDRVLIRCFCDVCLKSRIERKLIYDNAACRKEKGTSFAIHRLESFLRREYFLCKNNEFYFLKCDIKKYFPSINHRILQNLLREISFSEDEMWMIQKLISNESSLNSIGLPLGNQSSQWFALLYLNKVDHFIKEKLQIKYYIRYMDDMILIHSDKAYLKYCLEEIKNLCKTGLDLSLNNKTQIGKVKNGIDFLGYCHYLTPTGKVIQKLRNSSRVRLKRHLKTLAKLENKGLVDEKYIYARKNAYHNHIKDTSESSRLKLAVISNFCQKK